MPPLTPADLENRWSELADVLTTAGPEAVINVLERLADRCERATLFRLVIRKLGVGPKAQASLDAMIVVGEAAVADALTSAEMYPDERIKWTDEANCCCYNLAANLADCWRDGVAREPRHFESGLRYSERALAFRQALEKPAGPFAMAHWARGKHLLSLHRYDAAAEAFTAALDYERALADEDRLLLAGGFLSLARARMGDPEGVAGLQSTVQLLETRAKAADDSRHDAADYLAQLRESDRLN